jgi:hypothetical protein
MMRLPLPAIFAALVVVAAGSVLLSVYFKSDVYVINATSLAPGQNMTVTLDYIPTKLRIDGGPSRWYEVIIYANATFAATSGEWVGMVFNGVYRIYIMGGQTVEVRVVDAKDTHVKIVVYALPTL